MFKGQQTPLTQSEIRRLQEIEDNPFTPEDEALFAMFEAQGWSAEQRIAYLRQKECNEDPELAAE